MKTNRQPIRTCGRIVGTSETLPPGLISVVASNGYTVNAHLDRDFSEAPDQLNVGDEVEVEFSAYNMTQGRILRRWSLCASSTETSVG